MKLLTECIFCGSANYRFCFCASDRLHNVPGTYKVHECRDCGLLFLNPQPEPEDLMAHYPAEYCAYDDERRFEARDENLYRIFYGEDSSWAARLLHLPYHHALRTITGGPGTRLLDVGCGSGHFLAMMKRALGFDVYGVEAFGKNESFAKRHGLNIFRGTLTEAHFPAQFFDVVTMSHVLEHMPDPRAALKEVRRLLKPDGTLIIAVPNSASLLRYLFGRDWFSLDAPRHLFVPSVRNLRAFFSNEGFALERVRYVCEVGTAVQSLRYRLRQAPLAKLSRPVMAACLIFAFPISLFRLSDIVELSFRPSA